MENKDFQGTIFAWPELIITMENKIITYIAQITCAYDQMQITYKGILTNK